METARVKNAKTTAHTTHAVHPEVGSLHVNMSGAVFDKQDKPWYTLEEVAYALDQQLSETYGVDFHKVTRLTEVGLLKEKDITNELLLSPEFKYEPYPGFKPTPRRKPVTNNPEWDAAMEEVIAAFKNDDDDTFEDEFGNKY